MKRKSFGLFLCLVSALHTHAAVVTDHGKGLKNVLGKPLQECSKKPLAGLLRTGFCEVSKGEVEHFSICAKMTKKFLKFTAVHGKDFTQPDEQNDFPGLGVGDKWCLNASFWKDAELAGAAPGVFLKASNHHALQKVDLKRLRKYQLDHPNKEEVITKG